MAQTATSLDDLNRRIEIYSDQMFRQGRWEADLFKADLLRDLRVNELLSLGENAGTNLDRVTLAAERAVAIAEATPQFVTTERMEVVKAMHEELTRSLQFAREERIEVLNELQRIAAAERKILTDQTAQMSVNVVDHAFYRAAQLIAATLVSSAVGSVVFAAWVLRRLGPRRHPVQTVK